MSTGEIYLLGAIAGLTILLGLPVGRMRNVSTSAAAFLNAGAAGVLVFLLVETFEHGFEPVEHAVEEVTVESGGTWGEFIGKSVLFTAAGVGLLSLVYYERWMARCGQRERGPGGSVSGRVRRRPPNPPDVEREQLALFIAIGIGLHNFCRGVSRSASRPRQGRDRPRAPPHRRVRRAQRHRRFRDRSRRWPLRRRDAELGHPRGRSE